MKHLKTTIFFLLLAVTACQEDKIMQEQPSVASAMHFDIASPGVRTKATAESFEAADKIGLYVTDFADETTPMPLQISGNRANNLILTFDGAAWTPARTIWWGEGKSDVYAYYPYISEISDVNNQYFEVASDQTTAGDEQSLGGYEASDFLWAKAEGVSSADGAVTLAMEHVMSKLTVKIIAGEDYVGSLPDDASVLLHSTVTGARLDIETGAVVKDPYSGARSIRMRNLGVRTYDDVKALVYEAIVVPQMLETSVPLLEINSKSVSYLLEDSFNFRPGVAYTYTVTLNTSTTAIKVEIGCEIEDWNNIGESEGDGDSGDSGDGSQEGEDISVYTDLSADETANCYIVSEAGKYRFKAVQGNLDASVGNVKSVEVLWESFGTDVAPNVGDLVASVSYKNGYICFATPETFTEGNTVIAAKNTAGKILWSWHIWLTDAPAGQVYYNNAGTMMDRNLGATSNVPGEVETLGLLYQWGRKDPFLGSASISESVEAASTGTWEVASDGSLDKMEENPTTFYIHTYLPDGSWASEKTMYDPCPSGWRVPDGGENGVWATAVASANSFNQTYDSTCNGINFSGKFGDDTHIWYSATGYRYLSSGQLEDVGYSGYYWSCSPSSDDNYAYSLYFYRNGFVYPSNYYYRASGYAVRCLQE